MPNVDINPYFTASEKQSFQMNKNVYLFIFYMAIFLLQTQRIFLYQYSKFKQLESFLKYYTI